jgi:hypothetical protein
MRLVWTSEDEQLGRDLIDLAFAEPRDMARLESFYTWLDSAIFIDMRVVRQLMDRAWEDRDLSRAYKLYNTVVSRQDPVKAAFAAFLKPLLS